MDAEIIMLDDSEADRLIARRCFARTGLPYAWRDFSSGRDCLNYLHRSRTPVAGLFVDINMPGMGGYEVLDHLQAAPGLARIDRVAMLTSSDNPQDLQRAAEAGVAHFCTKPSDIQGYVDLFRRLLPASAPASAAAG